MRIAFASLTALLLLAGCLSSDAPATGERAAPAATGDGAEAPPEELAAGAVNATPEHVMDAEALSYTGRTETGACVVVSNQWTCRFLSGSNVLHLLPANAMHLVANLTWTPANAASPDLILMIVPFEDGDPQWGSAQNHTVTGPSPIQVDWHLGEFEGREFGLGVSSAEFTTAGPVTLLREVGHDFAIEGTLWTMAH